MNGQKLSPPKSKKGMIIGIAAGIVFLLLICLIAFIGTVAYWHWTNNINS